MEKFSVNYFSVLDLETSMEVSEGQLRAAYLEHSRKLHPDTNTHLSKDEARELTSLVNVAYQVLKNPVSRAKHILSLREYAAGESSAKIAVATFMELNLDVEEAIQENNRNRLESLNATIQRLINSNLTTIQAALAPNTAEGNDVAAKKISEITYLLRTLEKITTFVR